MMFIKISGRSIIEAKSNADLGFSVKLFITIKI
jgi:hypothetical protein